MKINNLTSPRSGRPVANQFEIMHNNERYFQSYNSIICKYDAAGRLVFDPHFWDYSVTTSKYRNQFTGLTTQETKRRIAAGSITFENLN